MVAAAEGRGEEPLKVWGGAGGGHQKKKKRKKEKKKKAKRKKKKKTTRGPTKRYLRASPGAIGLD